MKTEQVRFNTKRTLFGGHGSWVSKGGARLCGTTTARAVGIPKDVNVMYAVFSDKRSTNDFTITRRFPHGDAFPVYGVDVNYMMMLGARMLIERMYKRGYRYVRIEY